MLVSFSFFFSSRFLKWDGKMYEETMIDGKTLRFDGKLFSLQKGVRKSDLYSQLKTNI